MRKTPRSSREIVAIAFFILVPVVVLALMNDGHNKDQRQMIATELVPSNPGNDPSLSNGNVNASFGYANITTFKFTIMYQSDSNSSPTFVNITLFSGNFTINQTMQKTNPLLSNYTIGVEFYKSTLIPATGNFSFYFIASNGTNSTRYPSTGALSGPSILLLRNYTISTIPYRWLNSSNAITPTAGNYFMYNFPLKFDFTMYGHVFKTIQLSELGFLRFSIFTINNANHFPINVSTNDSHANFTIIAWSAKLTATMNYILDSTVKVLNGFDYFLVEQQVFLANDYPGYYTYWYNASYQYVLYKNGSIMLSYNYVKFNFPVQETVGVTLGDGQYYTPYNYNSTLTKISRIFNYNYVNSTRILNYSLTPLSGTQITAFNFTLVYQNLENQGPIDLTLTLDGKNYTLQDANPLDVDIVDGKLYSCIVQYLAGGVSHAYNFTVYGPWYWWHSPTISGPIVTYNNTSAPSIENFSMTPAQGYVNFTNMTIQFVYKDLDNDAPANLSIVFNDSSIIHTLNLTNVSSKDIIFTDGYTYQLDMRYTNVSFLYHALKFYIYANDSKFGTRYPANPTQWLNGPIWVVPLNYYVSKTLDFEYHIMTNYTTIISDLVSINLPFNFPFYGVSYNQLVFSDYGFVRFTRSGSATLPTPGSKDVTSWLSINVLGDQLAYDFYSNVCFQVFSDKIVFNFTRVFYKSGVSYPFLGDFEFTLQSDGNITFSFFDLTHANPGGINLGDGVHFTRIPITQLEVPLTDVSFIFNFPRPNIGVTVTPIVTGTLFNSWQQVTYKVKYISPNNIQLFNATCIISGKDLNGNAFSTITGQMTLDAASFVNYKTGAIVQFNRALKPGIYNISFIFYDIYWAKFSTSPYLVIVDDKPTISYTTPAAYGIVGQTFTINIGYFNNGSIAPEYFKIRYDGITYEMNHSSSNFSAMVNYTASFDLTHGVHSYYVYLKDKNRPDIIGAYDNQTKTIIARYLPVITIISLPPTTIYNPYVSYQITITITSAEPGFGSQDIMKKSVYVDGKLAATFMLQAGSPNTYTASVYIGDGSHTISIETNDGFNTVTWPETGTTFTVSVIDLPLILGIILPIAAVGSILTIYQVRKKKLKSIKQELLKKQVLARKPRQRNVPGDIEVKYKERQRETESIDAANAIPTVQSVVKKSAAVRKVATSGQAAKKPVPVTVIGHQKPAAAGRSHPRDKSKFAPRISDTTTIINRTVLKDYIERQRKEGIKELHFIKIKNDLNIISQNKSSRLYRLLQELVKDSILVRKGSLYIIV